MIRSVSFHLAAYLCGLVFATLAFGGPDTGFVLFLLAAALTAWISWSTRAHQPARWASPRLGGPSAVIFVGHLGPLAMAALWMVMARAGSGSASGLLLIPALLWGLLFYVCGIFWAVMRLRER